MSKAFNGDGIPAWHRFELIILDALRPQLPGGNSAGIILNRRLGHERATEADLLYAGTKNGRNVVVIIECKNRPITVSDSTIELPSRDGETSEDLMEQLARKEHDARTFLGFEEIFFIVVGSTKLHFRQRVAPNIFVVGQPIALWVDPTSEQDFSNLISTWHEVVRGIEPLLLDSVDYAKLRDLPRFVPWDTVERKELMQDIELDRHNSEMEYLMREFRGDNGHGDWTQELYDDSDTV
jgi:hypothetical protein